MDSQERKDRATAVFKQVIDEHGAVNVPELMATFAEDEILALKRENAALVAGLEESKIYRFKTMEEPAFKMLGEFVKFLNDALEADCPMITNWGVRIEETGEEIDVLNIWAATTHESPITRCRELRILLDNEKAQTAALVAALEALLTQMQQRGEGFKISIAIKEILEAHKKGATNG